MLSDVWSDNAPLFKRLMEIHSNPPILYYGFKAIVLKVLLDLNEFSFQTSENNLKLPLNQFKRQIKLMNNHQRELAIYINL